MSEDKWWGVDKLQHFSSSFYLVITGYYYLNRFDGVSSGKAKIYTAAITLNLGVGKELYDKFFKKSYFSRKDLVADLLGVLVGIVFVNNFI